MSIASRETKLTDALAYEYNAIPDEVGSQELADLCSRILASHTKLEQALGEAQEALQHYADAENSPMARRTLRVIAAHLKAGD